MPYAIAFTVFQFAKSIHVACIGRVIAGIAVGGSNVVLPIYIAEVAKPSSRGVLGSMMTISSVIGVLVYNSIAVYSTYLVYNIVTIVLSIVFCILFVFIGIESPYYYLRKQKIQISEDRIDPTKLKEGNSGTELIYIQNIKILSFLGSTGWMKSFFMMSFLLILHHLSGVGMIPMLLHYIATYLGYKYVAITYATVLLSSAGIELLGSFICLLLIDRIGRKACLIISTLCIGIFFVPIAVFAALRDSRLEIDPVPPLTILFVVMFLIFFYIGLAPVPQILLGELFPSRLKMVAAVYIVSFNQVSVFVVTNYFQEISAFIGYTRILFICTVSMLIAPIIIYFGIVETKKKSLQEIQIILKNK
ncbi:unnamed protein product [Diabrotica balteata]|uniref:Major facilitator superfamily (MFS) profile domain-containing protein n=1 Tax=Diabrotica balteata TaxID=107213 RepID=A0A9N9XFL4_DIABA|nr:unnamed protein product [Diabrotica balteata]